MVAPTTSDAAFRRLCAIIPLAAKDHTLTPILSLVACQNPTNYQAWSCYRIASKQVTLFHAGRQVDNSCRPVQECLGSKENTAHIFWDCPRPRACWGDLISHWTEEVKDRLSILIAWLEVWIDMRQNYEIEASPASATASGWPRGGCRRLKSHLFHNEHYFPYLLRRQRNDTVFRGTRTTARDRVARYWKLGIQRLPALAKREH